MALNVSVKQITTYIFRLLKEYPSALLIMLWMAVLWSIDLSLRPYLLKTMLNRVTQNDDNNIFSDLCVPILIYFTMYFLLLTSLRLHSYFVEIKMIPKLRAKIAEQSLNLLAEKSHAFYLNNFAGSLANKINDLTNHIPEITRITIDRFFSHALAFSVAIFTLWQLSKVFACLMLIWAVIVCTTSILISKNLINKSRAWSEYGSIISGKLVDILTNITSVRFYSTKGQEIKYLQNTFSGAVKAEQTMQQSYFWMWFYYGYLCLILQGFNFYFLLKGRQEGWISVGDFALVIILNISISDILWQVMKEFSQFSKILGNIQQALNVILAPAEINDKDTAQSLKLTQAKITFNHVSFCYQNTPRLFNDLSVIIAPGEKIGLVGYSGSGKSTFVNLLLRLYEVTDGNILIDNQNINDVTQQSLRDVISIIPQEPTLFHRSLLENIGYGCLNATKEEIIMASKLANAHGFIVQLKDNYNTMVGERGVKLSGGQRQRIAIARAILKNAPILILDEATSQLDSFNENLIQNYLAKFMNNKTTIVIAHRLSTLLSMDRILVFHEGKIIEDGSHSTLLELNGQYRKLWDSQIGGMIPKAPKTTEEMAVV